MFNKFLFIFAHQLGNPHFYPMYKEAIKNQWKTYDELKQEQEKNLRKMVSFAYNNVPFYHKVFKSLKLNPDDIKKLEDLEKLPVINKEVIRQNWDDFKPLNLKKMVYYDMATGGSSGTPLRYRVSKYDRFLAGALLYRGWGYGEYELGDKMVFLAGASLDVGNKRYFVKKAHETARNLRKLSSFDMGTQEMGNYVQVINSFNPKFLRGYPSSIDFFAKFINEYDIDIGSLDAIFTTSEKLYPHMAKNIENAFSCNVFDGYGLYDGGVGAYECKEHNGLHVDTERSIMEIVDENDSPIDDGLGRIIATSLHNYSMPFIRYDTGDMGYIIEDTCGCGRKSKLLKEIGGRSVDILYTPEGKAVHGWFFLFIFWEYCEGVKEYQVVQEKIDLIVIKIVKDINFDEKQLDLIKGLIMKKSSKWVIEFCFVDKIERTMSGKYKFIVNRIG